ncbi:GIY-YIG nuclease family protein [Rhodoferax fermentans]|uniref:GIY-YIG domain-containing protein n=1 Tax=Rhodoferax fermentans TaxID=28066 RepID=A0A1T1AP43_RHOFE|nr:GIY-YIG nuclease family protein [Rhodoferax fermentans]OOV05753.1 hypothetical protein RF819_02675 [Rhodoferax fermentans]
MARITVAGVYEIRNTLSNKVYIGSSVNVKRRLAAHRQHLRRGEHATAHLQSAWDKCGESAFEFKQLIVCDKKDVLFYEQRIMDGFKSNQKEFGYNKRIVVETCAGMKLTDEHKAKIAAAVPRGEAHQYYGKRLCDKAYEVAADLKRGKPMPDEQREKISRTLHGKKKPAGFGAKISAAKKGVKYTDEQKKNMTGCWLGKKHTKERREQGAKLSFAKADEVRRLYAGGGLSQDKIAVMMQVSRRAIRNVLDGKAWA